MPDETPESPRLRASAADPHASAAHHPDHVADPAGKAAAVAALRRGPRGAVAVSFLAVGVVMLLWVLFYLLVFLPRGPANG